MIDRTEAAWGTQLRDIGFSAAEQHAAQQAYAELHRSPHPQPPNSDRAGDAIARDHPWRSWLDMLSGALNGAELDAVSATDMLAYDDHASDANWRLPAGYGTLIASAASALPLSLETRVNAVDHGSTCVSIETSRGRIETQAAIVAVPTNVLARGDIIFSPAIDDHLHAAACLPLGQVEKLFLSMRDPEAVPPESHLLGNPHSTLTGSYYLRPFGRPTIECFFGGISARAMIEAGNVVWAQFAVEELGKLLGEDFARGLQPITGSCWHSEPTIGGAYSHALPGHADQRRILAKPAGERLYFAGEACSAHDFSTAHGAWQSGIDAAAAVDVMLSRQPITTKAAATPKAPASRKAGA